MVKVYEHVEGEGWETTSIKDLDSEAEKDLLNRFAMKARRDFKGQSLATYQGRFRKALASYRAYMEDPANFRGIIRQHQSAEPKKVDGRPRGNNGSGRSTLKGMSEDGVSLIEYPFPVRDGVLARLSLPADLRPEEAEPLSGFLKSLAIRGIHALPSGEVTPSA